jgi:hypothetical protein
VKSSVLERLRARRFSRRVGVVLVWCLAILGVAILVNVTGIRLVGSVAGWIGWLERHAGVFLIWRLVLYGVIALGWLWMRKRLLQREAAAETAWRLARIEAASLLVVALLESTQFLMRQA